MSEAYISIDHLSKKYDKDFVLKDVNAVLHKGEFPRTKRSRKDHYDQNSDRAAPAHVRHGGNPRHRLPEDR